MASSTLIVNAQIVNRGTIQEGDVLIQDGRIARIGKDLQHLAHDRLIDAKGRLLLPGAIDDQVHFREPGLTHKATIATESRAAVAGGVTSFMEMPNTQPQTLTQDLLEEKYRIAAKSSLANYSFYMGASNDNLEEVLRTNKERVCGVKVFMGSSTGNMLVDNERTLEGIFSRVDMLIATHCEDEATIRENSAIYRERYGEDVPVRFHPQIRSTEACYRSSSMAVALARKWGAQLHVLHISTAKELALFDKVLPLAEKKITAEACIHHLWFAEDDYAEKGNLIKWNPAVKTPSDRVALRAALAEGILDVLATDHAPHTLEEKDNPYFKAPSGGPLVQHSLVAALELARQGVLTVPEVVEKISHNPAILFRIRERGFIEEGYWADLVLVDPAQSWQVSKKNILYKCGWSPFEGQQFSNTVTHTWVSGELVWEEGQLHERQAAQRLLFNRDSH